jgi:hypothetical protein
MAVKSEGKLKQIPKSTNPNELWRGGCQKYQFAGPADLCYGSSEEVGLVPLPLTQSGAK